MLDPIMSSGVTQVAIVEFDSHVELKRDFTTDSDEIARELKSLQRGCHTRCGLFFRETVRQAASWLQAGPAARQ